MSRCCSLGHIKTSTLPCFGISSLILSFISLKSMSFPPQLQLFHQWLSITFQSAVPMPLPRHHLLWVTLVSTPLPTLISHSTIPVLCWHLCHLWHLSCFAPCHTHVSACTGGPRQSFSTVRGQMLSGPGRNEIVKSLGLRQQGIVFCEGLWNPGSRAWRWRAQAPTVWVCTPAHTHWPQEASGRSRLLLNLCTLMYETRTVTAPTAGGCED